MSVRTGKILQGTVISAKMAKTISVSVVTKTFHALYKKLMINRKKYKVHDEESKAKVGDTVKIIECRPYSKDKTFKLLEILK